MKKKKLNKAMKDKVTPKQFFKVQWKIIKELYQLYKLDTILIILLACLTMSVNFINLKFLEYSTNSVSAYMMGESEYSFKRIAMTIVLFLAALLIVRLLQNEYNKIKEKYVTKITLQVNKKINRKLSSISYEYYEGNDFYEKINLANQANSQYSNAIFGVTQIAKIIIMLVVYGFMLSKVNITYIIVIFIAIFFSFMISTKITDKQLDYWRIHVSPESRRNNYFKGVFANRINQQNIQVNRSFDFFSYKCSYYNERNRKNYLKLNMLSFTSELASSALFLVTFFFTALLVGKGVAQGEYKIGYYSMVIALLASLFSTIKQFSMFMLNNNWYVKILEAYYEVMDFKEDSFSKIHKSDTAINISELKYRYPQSEVYALNGINATFQKGEKIAVVGHNGCGKTTLISVILSLLKNYDGSFSGCNIYPAAILQDFGQYQMTVKENIEIGCGGKELSEERIKEILKKVDLYEFISQKPDGIYTKLGQLDKGVELSKGQWQRLAIARLLANEEANIWILDEPTAYLDPIAEIDMYKFIFDLASDRLVFFISHRLGFAKNANRIIVIDNGKIIEDGTHKDLMDNSNSLYARMFETQKEWYK